MCDTNVREAIHRVIIRLMDQKEVFDFVQVRDLVRLEVGEATPVLFLDVKYEGLSFLEKNMAAYDYAMIASSDGYWKVLPRKVVAPRQVNPSWWKRLFLLR